MLVVVVVVIIAVAIAVMNAMLVVIFIVLLCFSDSTSFIASQRDTQEVLWILSLAFWVVAAALIAIVMF